MTGRSLGSRLRSRNFDKSGRRVDVDLTNGRLVGHHVKGGGIRPLIRDPEGTGGAVRNTPRVMEFGIGDPGQLRDVRNQIGLDKFGILGLAMHRRIARRRRPTLPRKSLTTDFASPDPPSRCGHSWPAFMCNHRPEPRSPDNSFAGFRSPARRGEGSYPWRRYRTPLFDDSQHPNLFRENSSPR